MVEKSQRQKRLERKIKREKNLCDQFIDYRPMIRERIENMRERLADLHRDEE
jgi:hypothetical protein